MYVETMTTEQMLDEYKQDAVSSEGFIRNKVNDFRRIVIKSNTFPARKVYEWKSPRGNKYLIRFHAEYKKECKHGQVGVCVCWFALINTEKGVYMFDASDHCSGNKSIDGDGKMIASPPKMYTSHALARYKERFGLKAGYKDIYHQFVIRDNEDSYGSAVEPGMFSRSHGGDAEVLVFWRDGIFLGIAEKDMLKINTYLSPDTILTEKQKEYITSLAQCHSDAVPLYRLMRDRYMSDPKRTKYIDL